MPFELGLTVASGLAQPGAHTWFVLETVKPRLAKSLSDLDGTDPYIHGGTPDGLFRELGYCFVRRESPPGIDLRRDTFRELQTALPGLIRDTGAQSPFEANVFHRLVLAAEFSVLRLK